MCYLHPKFLMHFLQYASTERPCRGGFEEQQYEPGPGYEYVFSAFWQIHFSAVVYKHISSLKLGACFCCRCPVREED